MITKDKNIGLVGLIPITLWVLVVTSMGTTKDWKRTIFACVRQIYAILPTNRQKWPHIWYFCRPWSAVSSFPIQCCCYRQSNIEIYNCTKLQTPDISFFIWYNTLYYHFYNHKCICLETMIYKYHYHQKCDIMMWYFINDIIFSRLYNIHTNLSIIYVVNHDSWCHHSDSAIPFRFERVT